MKHIADISCVLVIVGVDVNVQVNAYPWIKVDLLHPLNPITRQGYKSCRIGHNSVSIATL